MSYNTRLYGQIDIVPDFETLGSVPKFDSVKLENRTELRHPHDMYAPVRTVIGAISADAPEWVDQDIVAADLTAIVDYIAAKEPDTKFVGYLEGSGAEPDDRWRAYIVDSKVVFVEPEIVWPGAPDAAA